MPTDILNNTIRARCDAEGFSYLRPWCGAWDKSAVFRISGNLIDFQRATPGQYIPECRIVDGDGVYQFGANWFRPGYGLNSNSNPPRTGMENLVTSDQPPGYRDESNGDYSLVDGAPATGFGAGVMTPVPPLPPPSPPPPQPPPPPPAKVWTEIARSESDPVPLAPGLRQRDIRLFEQEK